jgi:hypothetical protein
MVFPTGIAGVDVRLFRASVDMFQLTEGQVDGIAQVNVATAVCVAFFGVCAGTWATCYTTLEATSALAPVVATKLLAMEFSSGCLGVFFFLLSLIGILGAIRSYRKIKRPAKKQ